MSADRCPTCDREGCPAEDHWKQYRAAEDAGNYDLAVESLALFDECGCELVDWRARAIAAESQIASVAAELADDLATAQAEIDRAVAGLAVASMLPSMSRLRHGATPTVRVWLGRLVEKLRGGAVESDAAKDRDAAKWRKVEPLIKRLCAFEDGPTDLRDLLTVALDVLATTKEPS